MAQPHAKSGEVVSLRPIGEGLSSATTTAVLKAEQLEVVRVVLPAGKEMREHKAPGEVTVHCIEGRIEFRTSTGTQFLNPGDFIHLQRQEPHALKAIEDASALMTICLVAG